MKPAPYALVIIACLTLGLAPLTPEPHILGKLRWVAGGAKGMGVVDWFDLLMHGAPWVALVALLSRDAIRLVTRRRASHRQQGGERSS